MRVTTSIVRRILARNWAKLSREAVWVLLGQIGALAGNLIGVRIMTELLAPAMYGQLALALTLTTLVNQTSFGPLASAYTRFFSPAAAAGEISDLLTGAFQLIVVAFAGVFALIVFGGSGLYFARDLPYLWPVVYALTFAAISGTSAILSGIQNAARHRDVVATVQALDPWIRALAACLCVLSFGPSSQHALLGYVFGSIIVVALQLIFLRRFSISFRRSSRVGFWRAMVWKYAWPMGATGVISWAALASQRWALDAYAGAKDVGCFSALYQVGYTPFALAGGMLLSLISPIIFSRVGDGSDNDRLKYVSSGVTVFCLVGSILVGALAVASIGFNGKLFSILVAEQYRSIAHYLPAMILAGGLFQVSLILSTIVLASTETKRLLSLNIFGNAIIVILNFSATRMFGFVGLLIAMICGSMLHLSWNMYNIAALRRQRKNSPDGKRLIHCTSI